MISARPVFNGTKRYVPMQAVKQEALDTIGRPPEGKASDYTSK
uniref:Uncharacterized protein n=1 Tax=Candidatus Kentrum sp. DK TaxID=2126562 RepID=A0A450TL31_9GAMM|nr:MAG: hypothetical protein BECKDK2373C_GA0170839_11833 [Candidatus Kentron sp. DK]VFJ68766.1 MAG: hypothetical protein BECKDK2373B_GA0170837_12224 [Candidatus Kentron sp. DK]